MVPRFSAKYVSVWYGDTTSGMEIVNLSSAYGNRRIHRPSLRAMTPTQRKLRNLESLGLLKNSKLKLTRVR